MPVPERSYDLVQRMRELGADDPESWARSELNEDIPQEARWLLLRQLWRRFIAGPDLDAPEDAPSWALMEIRRDEDYEEIETGRHVGGLHESILSADPSGRDGADLWA